MKRNNTILNSIMAVVILLILSACSGGGGSDASFSDTQSRESINIDCITNPTALNIASYIDLNSGDTIVKEDTNATVSIYHNADGTKKVCRVVGSSYIIRAN